MDLNKLLLMLQVKNSQTLIDWALTNHHELNSEVLLSPKISDHSFIKIKIVDIKKNAPCKIKVKCFKNYSKEKLSAKLNQIDWDLKILCLMKSVIFSSVI